MSSPSDPTTTAAPCPSFAIECGVVIDCVLPLGHEGSHDPGDMDRALLMMREGTVVTSEPARSVRRD